MDLPIKLVDIVTLLFLGLLVSGQKNYTVSRFLLLVLHLAKFLDCHYRVYNFAKKYNPLQNSKRQGSAFSDMQVTTQSQ
jgi:hypothetical protein